jgi:chemotaxis signal transduction protein
MESKPPKSGRTEQQTALNIDSVLPHMRDVQRCEASLRELNLMWRVIEANAKMNCPDEARTILPMIAATRRGFERLERELVSSLAHEKVANVLGEVGTKAQHVVDIVVRNLYERTADVGFLATDSVLCQYAAGLDVSRELAVERLRAYRDKYTVYDDIVLLDAHGAVLAHIDGHSPIEGSTDPLIAQTLACDSHVETFRTTDLRPGKGPALVYSRRMLHPTTRQPVGVLCMVFGFETEMDGIFASRHDREGRSLMLLLDGNDCVIASADEAWVPRGTRVPVNRSTAPSLRVHAGREYLVQTYTPEAYQGYPGPQGWQGQVMIPVDVAFHGREGGVLETLDSNLTEGLLQHARSFCPPLHEIVTAADTIRRVVWNGQVMSTARPPEETPGAALHHEGSSMGAGSRRDLQKLKTVLEQISDTGARTNHVFAQSIRDLYDTVLGASLASARALTHLMVDLLDRNLYERSDDCRWWAMSPVLRQALSQPGLASDAARLAGVSAVLDHINGLYTVYSRLVVYDTEGRILAASHHEVDGGLNVLGQCIEADTLEAVCQLKTEQAYHVTPFRPSPLYSGRPTFIYHAAIRAADDERRIVGGIGIVFNAADEFDAMLRGALGDRPDTRVMYVDRRGMVIASTDAEYPVGSRVDLPQDLLALPGGTSTSRVLQRKGHYMLLGASWNAGYREFKVSDGYTDDVLALSFESLGELREQRRHGHSAPTDAGAADDAARLLGTRSGGHEFATFFLDSGLSALPAEMVLEALPGRDVAPVSLGTVPHRVGMLARRRDGQVQSYVWVFDLNGLVGGAPSPLDDNAQVIVVEHLGRQVGLLVHELHGVPEFDAAQIVPAPLAAGGEAVLVSRVIKAQGGRLLIPVLDIAQLLARLGDQPVPHAAPQTDCQAVLV